METETITKKDLELIPKWLYERGWIDRLHDLFDRDEARRALKQAAASSTKKYYQDALDQPPDFFIIKDVIRLIKEMKK